MGLDQYAGFRDSKGEVHDTFYWRKHSRLQVFFAGEYKEQHKSEPQKSGVRDTQRQLGDLLEEPQGGFGDLSHLGFNGGQGGVKITEELVNRLDKERREGYPNCVAEDGFFWGQQFQKESVKEYKAQDEEFVKWCREQLALGKDIGYDCSW